MTKHTYMFYVHNNNYLKYLLIRNAKAGKGLINTIGEMTTDEMLSEIVRYKYKSIGFPFVFMDYSQTWNTWSITWRNPIDFINTDSRKASTPNEACKKALEFINSNPNLFWK